MKALKKGVFPETGRRLTMPDWNSIIHDAVLRDFEKRKSKGIT